MIEHNCIARPVFPHDSRVEMDSLAKALAAMAARVDALERELALVKKRLKGPSVFGPSISIGRHFFSEEKVSED